MTPFEKWSGALKTLLARAKALAPGGSLDARLTLMDELTSLVVHSTPNTPDILALDELARACIRDIALSGIEERVARISARTSELASLEKRFGQLATDANERAAAINLEQINKTVGSLTGTVASLNELRASLTSAQHGQLAGRISDVIERVRALRKDIDALT